VKQPEKPVTPDEELAFITIDDIRQLGRTLEESISKIVEKVDILGEESLLRRSAGVAAWRRSPVHQLYLSIGRESLSSGKSVEEVMSDRKRQEKPYLTANEFAAIADLNRRLIA
jgi:hypothetical protein